MFCTMPYCSSLEALSDTFQLTGNLKEVIAPRVAEGKLTLRLNLPDVYVYVENANPEVLGEWVTILMHIKDKPHFGTKSDWPLSHSSFRY